MKNKLNGKIAVISGGSSGIGYAIAVELKKLGVTIYDISKDIAHEELFKKSFKCDISDDSAVLNAVQQIVLDAGKVDLLFCNAGFGVGGAFENAKIETIDSIMNVNLIAHMKMTNLFLPHINENGRIIFTGSLASIIPLPYQACYSASKAGIENFGRALSTELRDKKIKVVTVMPGDINTGFTDARIKQTKQSSAENRSITKMEKNERKGKDASFVAKRVVKLIKKKNPPLRVSIGGTSKFISFLIKVLPIKAVNFLVRKIYI